jgi:plasmid rolling circle replication initiator protein Rep
MPRFHVIMVDTVSNEICGYITRIESAVDAICNHPWFTEIYRSEWVAKHIDADTMEETIANTWKLLAWSCLCVNLDEEIMKDLNGGGSSVSLATQQS